VAHTQLNPEVNSSAPKV